MVNNFEQIRKLLKFENEGDCYYVQLLRRQSDDPHVDGKADPKYHGNMHSRSIKDYLITSLEHFDTVWEDIVKMCETFNVRAYIRLNRRNFKQISLAMLKHIAEQTYSGQAYNSPYRVVASAAGMVCTAGEDKTWIVDLDEEYVPFQDTLINMICDCEPHVRNIKALQETLSEDENAREVYIAGRFEVIPTKHGRHIVCRPFNIQALNVMWNEYCEKNQITMPMPRMFNDPENKYTVFELTDIHLSRAKDFTSVFSCPFQTSKKDNNKLTVTTDKMSDEKLSELSEKWRKLCIDKKYWMKLCDIHKDNPTILYVP